MVPEIRGLWSFRELSYVANPTPCVTTHHKPKSRTVPPASTFAITIPMPAHPRDSPVFVCSRLSINEPTSVQLVKPDLRFCAVTTCRVSLSLCSLHAVPPDMLQSEIPALFMRYCVSTRRRCPDPAIATLTRLPGFSPAIFQSQ